MPGPGRWPGAWRRPVRFILARPIWLVARPDRSQSGTDAGQAAAKRAAAARPCPRGPAPRQGKMVIRRNPPSIHGAPASRRFWGRSPGTATVLALLGPGRPGAQSESDREPPHGRVDAGRCACRGRKAWLGQGRVSASWLGAAGGAAADSDSAVHARAPGPRFAVRVGHGLRPWLPWPMTRRKKARRRASRPAASARPCGGPPRS